MSQFISAQDRQKKGHAHLIKKKIFTFKTTQKILKISHLWQ